MGGQQVESRLITSYIRQQSKLNSPLSISLSFSSLPLFLSPPPVSTLQGRCSRENCKYLHPPPHLKTQLEINGRNNLIQQKNMAMLAQQMQLANAMMPGTQLQPVVRGHICIQHELQMCTCINTYRSIHTECTNSWHGKTGPGVQGPVWFPDGFKCTFNSKCILG